MLKVSKCNFRSDWLAAIMSVARFIDGQTTIPVFAMLVRPVGFPSNSTDTFSV